MGVPTCALGVAGSNNGRDGDSICPMQYYRDFEEGEIVIVVEKVGWGGLS